MRVLRLIGKTVLWIAILFFITVLILYIKGYPVVDKGISILFPPEKLYYARDSSGKPFKTSDHRLADYYRIVSFDWNDAPIGTVRDYFMNDSLLWEGHLLSNDPFTPNGECLTYFQNGQTEFRENYKDGQRHGEVYKYYENGVLAWQGHFEQGHEHGLFTYQKENKERSPHNYYIHGLLVLRDYNLDAAVKDYGLGRLDTIAAYVSAGDLHYEQKAFNEAMASYSSALSLCNSLAIVLEKRGFAYHNLEQYDGAIIDFENALLNGHQGNYGMYYLLGESYNHQANLPLASKYLVRSIDLCPPTEEGAQLLSLSYDLMGSITVKERKFDAATAWYTKAIDLDSSNPFLFSDRAFAYLGSQRKDLLQQAIADCNTSISLAPQNFVAYTYRSNAHLLNGDAHQALKDARIAKGMAPEDVAVKEAFRNAFETIYPPLAVTEAARPSQPVAPSSFASFAGKAIITFIVIEYLSIARLALSGKIFKAMATYLREEIIGTVIGYLLNGPTAPPAPAPVQPIFDHYYPGNQFTSVSEEDKLTWLTTLHIGKDAHFPPLQPGWDKKLMERSMVYAHANYYTVMLPNWGKAQYLIRKPYLPEKEVRDVYHGSKNLMVTNVDAAQDYCFVMLTHFAERSHQVFLSSHAYPADEIVRHWNYGLRITEASLINDSTWFFVFTQSSKLFPLRSQYVQVFEELNVLKEQVNLYHDAGYHVTVLKKNGSKYILVMSEYEGRSSANFRQIVDIDEGGLPIEKYVYREKEGFILKSFSFDGSHWLSVFNKLNYK